MKIGQLMSVDLIVAHPDDPVAELLGRFAAKRINGAPVAVDGQLVGIVTTTDLMRSWEQPGVRVRDVMTREVVTLTEDMTVAEAARVLARAGLHRAPVLRDAMVVGMLTRTDLLRPHLRTDAEIDADIEQIIAGPLGIERSALHARVLDGMVFLEGAVPSRRVHALLMQLVSSSAGVVDVVDHVRITPLHAAASHERAN